MGTDVSEGEGFTFSVALVPVDCVDLIAVGFSVDLGVAEVYAGFSDKLTCCWSGFYILVAVVVKEDISEKGLSKFSKVGIKSTTDFV